jgi:hypothetical protein
MDPAFQARIDGQVAQELQAINPTKLSAPGPPGAACSQLNRDNGINLEEAVKVLKLLGRKTGK